MFTRSKDFKYLGSEISCENETHIQHKLVTFVQVLGIRNNTFKPNLIQIFSRIKVCNALALHSLLCGSEIWTLRKKDKKRLT
jgi:hypothetical protein